MPSPSTLIELTTALLTVAGIAYMVLAVWSARAYARSVRRERSVEAVAPAVSVLKPLKGVDPRMYAGLASHARQQYGGVFELVFGVHDPDDPAVEQVRLLHREFPGVAIKLVVCPLMLGSSGKVSNLVQMLPHARHPYILINDSDILVSPGYLAALMGGFAPAAKATRQVGMVTAP